MQIIPYILTVAFVLSFCMYSKYQFRDERGQSAVKGRWHPYGAIMRLCVVLMAAFAYGWRDGLLIGAITLPLFDIGINVLALENVSPFYVGTTAGFDKRLGMWKWPLYLLLLLAAIYFKIQE